jgi:hypothetical protein
VIQIGKSERLTCPPAFQSYLTELFGVNVFGEPNFKLVWGQTETFKAATEHGYEDKLLGHNMACWIILKWQPPEMYGSPDLYYFHDMDEVTGLALCGEYPELGRYEILQPLIAKNYNPQTHALEITTLPLDWDILEIAIPMLMRSQELTYWEKKSALDQIEAMENADQVNEIADRMFDALPAVYGAQSFAGQGIKTSVLARQMEKIEQKWKQLGVQRREQPTRGLWQK